MQKIAVTVFATVVYVTPSYAQTPPGAPLADPVTITIPRKDLNVIGQGLMELPFKSSAAVLNELQRQLDAADRAAAEKAAGPGAGGTAAPPQHPSAPGNATKTSPK